MSVEWLGPAVIAAVIAALINIVGWFVTLRNARHLERTRRREKIVDIQTALLAEIRSDYKTLSEFDEAAILVSLKERYASSNPQFSPFVPRDAGAPVFESVVGDISILPTEVIDPIVVYYKQHEAIAHFAEDLRTTRFADLPSQRQLEMLEDYLQLKVFARSLARDALDSLELSLGFRQQISKPVSDQSAPQSASAAETVSQDHEQS